MLKNKIISFIFIFAVTVPAVFAFLIIFANYASGINFTQNDLDKAVIFASRKYGVPVPFLIAVMRAESDFNINAVSPEGAVGLMQIMPETGEAMRLNIYDPLTNIIAGAEYLRYCLSRFGSDPVPALACYNAGPASVRKVRYRTGNKYILPPYDETRIYISKVYYYYKYYSKILK